MLGQLWKLNKKDNSYIPGGCFREIIPMLILQAMDQFSKYKHKTITFVSNVDVQAFITLSQ